MSADHVDVGQARGRTQGRTDARIVEQAQFTQAGGLIGWCLGVFGVLQGIIDDFTKTGADRRHDRDRSGRQVAGSLADAFRHQLASSVDVRSILEDEGDLRESGLRKRTELDQPGQTRKLGLQRDGHPGLGLVGGERRQSRVDLHLRPRDVGHRVDRHA